jgi:CheY-like chemotaxis protein
MILLVDDDREQTALREAILARSGFSVTAASTRAEALERCAECEAVVMDLRMPTLGDGLALIRELHVRIPAARIFVLAGYPDELSGQPERRLVHAILRKGSGARALIDLLRSNSVISQ